MNKIISTYLITLVLISNWALGNSNPFVGPKPLTSGKQDFAVEPNSWFLIKPAADNLPLEVELLGKNSLSIPNLGIFNGISNRNSSLFTKLEKGIFIGKSAIFGTDKIKTPRTALAINSAIHFANSATYEFRDAATDSSNNWDNLSGKDLKGTVKVNPDINSHINGYVSYDGAGAFVYPLGDGVNKYYPITINGNSGQTITSAWLPNDPSGNNDPTDNTTAHNRSSLSGNLKFIYPSGQWDWHIRSTSLILSAGTIPTNTAPAASVTISVTIPQDVDLITNGVTNNLRLAGWNGTSWEALNNSMISSGVITAVVNKSFSALTFGAIDNTPLPVTLISFSARKEENNAILNWVTTSETNSKYFNIEHSTTGKAWNKIGSVDAQGESINLESYQFTDKNTLDGDNFYRLQMLDSDESFAYSQIQVLNFKKKEEVTLFPNPASDKLFIKINYDWNDIDNVSIYTLNGALIHSAKSNEIDLSQFSSGKYFVVITRINGNKNSYNILVTR